MMTVRLQDDTTGESALRPAQVEKAITEKTLVEISLQDENGNSLLMTGVPVEILEEAGQ